MDSIYLGSNEYKFGDLCARTVLSNCICCYLGLFISINRPEDYSCLVAETVLKDWDLRYFFIGVRCYFVIFLQGEINFCKVLTVKK